MLNSQKFEFPDKICQIHSATFHNTEYRVQTILGTFSNHYKPSESEPIHGNGQSAGSSGTNWVYISVPITSTLDKHGEGCIIVSPDKKIKWELVIIGSVDDKRQYANDRQNNSLLVAFNKLRAVAQSLEHLLYTSGGKLELTKCAWYCISWTFNPDGTPKMSNNTSYKIILLDSATQQHHTIKQLPIHSPFKYLGSENTSLGTTGYPFLSRKKYASRGTRISNSNMNRFHITLYLKTPLHPKIMLPLDCTFLTSKQYASIQNLYINPALSTMGYNHTWPVALHFGDHKYCGL